MSTVYAAHDPGLERRIALKLLHDVRQQPLLVHEAKALAKLQHPNVVAVHDVGTFQGRVFVAMELVEGITLKRWFAEPRSWREIVEAMLHAARGLAAAHAAGIIHGDFKPENVLVGNDGRIRVLD